MAGTTATAIKKLKDYFWGESPRVDGENGVEEPIAMLTGYPEAEEESIETMDSSIKLPFSGKSTRGKLISMPQAQPIRMKISKPTNFDQVDEIINELKQKNAVVINLEYVSKDVARRIVDVVSGAIKALDGRFEKVSNSIFVVAPTNYDITNEVTKEKVDRKYSATVIK